MTKSQEGISRRTSPVSSSLYARSTTPPPTEVDENIPPQTTTPHRLVRLGDSCEALSSEGAPDTPSRHMANARDGGIKDLGSLAIITLVAHQFIQKLKDQAPLEVRSTREFHVSSPLDFVLSNVVYKQEMYSRVAPAVKSYSMRVMIHNIDFGEMLASLPVTREREVLFPSKAYTAKIFSLGTYREIGQQCSDLITNYSISDQVLAEYMENIYSNASPKSLELKHDDNQFLLDLSTLLYATEGHRHQSAYIIHKMFMDLVKAERYCFKDMRKILPMAIEGAVTATIMLDKILFAKDLRDVTLYYYKSSKLITSQDTIEEFVARTNQIVADWLCQKEFSGSTPQEKYDFIKEHLADWYGGTVISQDEQDTFSSVLDEDASSQDSPHKNTRKRKASRSEEESSYSKRQKPSYEEDSDTSVLDAESGYEGSPTLSQTSDRMGLTEAEVPFKASLPTALQLSESSPSSSQASLLPDADLTGESWGGWFWNLFG